MGWNWDISWYLEPSDRPMANPMAHLDDQSMILLLMYLAHYVPRMCAF